MLSNVLIARLLYVNTLDYTRHQPSFITPWYEIFLLRWISGSSSTSVVTSTFKPKSTAARGQTTNSRDLSAEINFDRHLARASLGIDGFADALVAGFAVFGRSSTAFYVLSCFSSLASGGNPSLHSLAVICLHASGRGSELGALFGAIGMLDALAHIVSVCFLS